MSDDLEPTASLETLARRIRDALLRTHASRDEWIRATFDLAHSLKAARETLPAHPGPSRDESRVRLTDCGHTIVSVVTLPAVAP
jgi:hypothetical protein